MKRDKDFGKYPKNYGNDKRIFFGNGDLFNIVKVIIFVL